MVRVLIAGLLAMVIAVAVGPQFIQWLRRQSIGQHIREEGPARHAVKQGTPTMGGLLILVAALIPALVVVVIGPKFIEVLRSRNLGQQIRAEGPATHVVKQGTPTMGGLLIIASAVIPFLAVSQYTAEGLTVLLIVVGCALIGFTDDYLKVRRRRSLGLRGRWKMLGLVLITAGVAWATTRIGYMDTEIYFPLVDVNIDLGWAYYPFLFLVIAGTSNAVNLTDGIDGLAAGTCAISLITLLALASID